MKLKRSRVNIFLFLNIIEYCIRISSFHFSCYKSLRLIWVTELYLKVSIKIILLSLGIKIKFDFRNSMVWCYNIIDNETIFKYNFQSNFNSYLVSPNF